MAWGTNHLPLPYLTLLHCPAPSFARSLTLFHKPLQITMLFTKYQSFSDFSKNPKKCENPFLVFFPNTSHIPCTSLQKTFFWIFLKLFSLSFFFEFLLKPIPFCHLASKQFYTPLGVSLKCFLISISKPTLLQYPMTSAL